MEYKEYKEYRGWMEYMEYTVGIGWISFHAFALTVAVIRFLMYSPASWRLDCGFPSVASSTHKARRNGPCDF
jgi:hypothetical protein